MVSLHNYERHFEREIERIKESGIFSDNNRKIVLGFKDYLTSEGIGLAKIARYLGDMFKFNRLLKMEFNEAKKEDIRRVVSMLNQEPLSEQTKRSFKIMIRKFYCYIRGYEEKGNYPDEVKWMRMEVGCKHHKLPEELLTEEEIRIIVKHCTGIRDKALIATLAESGCRISEVGLMKIKHISFESYGARLSVNGKTGSRKILVINSAPFLQEWINSHPENDNPESYLWYNPQNKAFLTYNRIKDILKESAKNAGIKKRVYPHLLRHSRATQLASIMSDSQLKNYLGWTQGSKMAGIYVHMSGKDADNAILRANNIQDVEQKMKDPILKPHKCLKCKMINPATNKFCNGCGFVLDAKMAESIIIEETKEQQASTLLSRLLQDKEVMALLQRKMEVVA